MLRESKRNWALCLKKLSTISESMHYRKFGKVETETRATTEERLLQVGIWRLNAGHRDLLVASPARRFASSSRRSARKDSPNSQSPSPSDSPCRKTSPTTCSRDWVRDCSADLNFKILGIKISFSLSLPLKKKSILISTTMRKTKKNNKFRKTKNIANWATGCVFNSNQTAS